MSIEVSTMVWKCKRFREGTLLVLLAMADWADDDGSGIFPRLRTLADKARLSERGTQAVIRRLESDGVVECVRRATGKPGRANEYRIVLDRLRPDVAARDKGDDGPKPDSGSQGVQQPHPSTGEVDGTEGCSSQRQGVQLATQRGEVGDRYIDNCHTEPSCNRQTARRDAGADAPAAAERGWGRWRSPAMALFGDAMWQAWFEGSQLVETGQGMRVMVSTPFKRKWIAENFTAKLERLFGGAVTIAVCETVEA